MGWYVAPDAAPLVGVTSNRLGQWARRGYVPSSQQLRPRVYAYQDIAEALAVHQLIDRGVPPADVMRAVRNLRDEYGRWPLSHAPLATTWIEERGRSGRAQWVIHREGDDRVDIGSGEGREQFLSGLEIPLRDVFNVLAKGGWVTIQHPDIQHVEVDPDRMGGLPTIKGRRILAAEVARMAREMPIEDLLEDYDLTPEEIQDAIRWDDLTQGEAA